MHLAERALAKITQGWVFIAFLLQMLKTYYFTRDGCRTFIVHFPCQKMKTFLFVWIISEKVASNETLKVRSIVCVFLFRQSFLNPCIDNPQSILFKPLLTCLTAFALQLFIFQLSHSPCFKPSIFLIGLIILTQSFRPVSTLDWQYETVIILHLFIFLFLFQWRLFPGTWLSISALYFCNKNIVLGDC